MLATVTGSNFISGTTFSMAFTTVTVLSMSSTQAQLSLAISGSAPGGSSLAMTVQSSAGSFTLGPVPAAFSVLSGTPPSSPPTLASVSPSSGYAGTSLNLVVQGNNFTTGTTFDFGPNFTVSNLFVASSTSASMTLAIGATAPPATYALSAQLSLIHI